MFWHCKLIIGKILYRLDKFHCTCHTAFTEKTSFDEWWHTLQTNVSVSLGLVLGTITYPGGRFLSHLIVPLKASNFVWGPRLVSEDEIEFKVMFDFESWWESIGFDMFSAGALAFKLFVCSVVFCSFKASWGSLLLLNLLITFLCLTPKTIVKCLVKWNVSYINSEIFRYAVI